VLARFYSSSGDAQAQARCVVPARVLPGEVILPRHVEPLKGCPSLWQNPSVVEQLDMVVADHGARNRIVIDVDDDYGSSHDLYTPENAAIHLNALEFAHTVTCTTEPLAEVYRERHADVRVIPTCVEIADYEFGRQINHLDGRIRIGYAAGRTHAPDAKIVGEALKEIAEAGHEGLVIEFVGAFDPGWDFPYNRYPALPFPAYKAMIQTWNIGLAPLEDSDLNRTRSDLKFLDYAACGAVAVVSPGPAFDHLIERDLVASAETTEDWVEALQALIASDRLRAQIALNAYHYCRVERHPANQRVAYLDAFGLTRSHAHA
jgi:hypothetical protein